MKNKLFLWPLSKPLAYSPLGYVFAISWNISEITRIPLPKAEYLFGVIIGRRGEKKQERAA